MNIFLFYILICVCHLEKSAHAGEKKLNKKQKPIHEKKKKSDIQKRTALSFYYIIKHNLLVYVGLHI